MAVRADAGDKQFAASQIDIGNEKQQGILASPNYGCHLTTGLLQDYVMARRKHPSKEIENALRELEALGWMVEEAKGRSAHSWGFVLCPRNMQSDCRSGVFCRMSIWSTPTNPQNHARELLRKAEGCVFKGNDDD